MRSNSHPMVVVGLCHPDTPAETPLATPLMTPMMTPRRQSYTATGASVSASANIAANASKGGSFLKATIQQAAAQKVRLGLGHQGSMRKVQGQGVGGWPKPRCLSPGADGLMGLASLPLWVVSVHD